MTQLHVQKLRVESIEDLDGVLDGTDTLSVPLSAAAPQGTILHASTDELTLSAGQWSADIRTRGCIGSRRVSLGMKLDPDSTHFSFRSGTEVFPGDVYTLSRGDAVDYRVSGRLSYAFVTFDAERLLKQVGEDALRLDKGFWEQRRWFRAPAALRAAIVRTVQSMVWHVARSDWTVTGQALHQLQSELTECFLRGIVFDERSSLERQALSCAAIVRKVEDWVDGQAPETIQIGDLCAALHLSRRTLQRAFTETLGMGPAHYLMLKRLAAVRTELRRSDPLEVTVTDVATKYGFWELGRFAHEYRQLFRERPSETLSKALR
jgi:AraC family ethanolamine operon transcriptional activator